MPPLVSRALQVAVLAVTAWLALDQGSAPPPNLDRLLDFGALGLAAWLGLKLWVARVELAWYRDHTQRLTTDNRELRAERDSQDAALVQCHAQLAEARATNRMWQRTAREEGWTDDAKRTVALPRLPPRPPPLPPPLEPEPRRFDAPSPMDDDDDGDDFGRN